MANTFTFGGMPVDLEELAVMDYSHEKNHDGGMFMAHYYGGTLASGGTLMMTITAGTNLTTAYPASIGVVFYEDNED